MPKLLSSLSSENRIHNDNQEYPLGKIVNPKFRDYPFLNLFPKTVTISSMQKNMNSHGGLLITGWGGVGKTVLANNIAHEAYLSGHQIIRFYQHDNEMDLGQGTGKYTDADEFHARLTVLSKEESIHSTVVIIDSLEAYVVREEKDWSPQKADEILQQLVSVKTNLEKRFTDKILFVFTLKDSLGGTTLFPQIYPYVASTVVGRVGAHYEIGGLLRKDSPSHLYYRISDLETGEFVVIDEDNAPIFRGAEPIYFHSM